MRLRELTRDIDGLEIAPGEDAAADPEIPGITADSRDVAKGFLFAAIPGTRMDGAQFIPSAIAAGAVAIVTANDLVHPSHSDITFLRATNPRAALAAMAARIYPGQPEVICAITGTNGKTSIASFLRQIWQYERRNAASMGTLGVVTDTGAEDLRHTTPDPVTVHRTLNALDHTGITHLALEASSHGLAQHRLDGVRVIAGAFTNLSRDHLDYHEDFEAYLAAKMRLFTDIVAEDGSAILNADADCFDVARDAAKKHGLRIFGIGEKGEALRLLSSKPTASGLTIDFGYDGKTYDVDLPLVGTFQASNVLVAAGLALAAGSPIEAVVDAMKDLKGADGRMERVASLANGAAIFVDYAHTPDALATALKALRPHTEGKLHVVFGAGGDRDKGKRPQMGRVATQNADHIIVTDDNPRDEDPSTIRAEILTETPGATEIADRRSAIQRALQAAGPGDTVLVAGKGHEEGQTIKGVTHPFKDADVVRDLAAQVSA